MDDPTNAVPATGAPRGVERLQKYLARAGAASSRRKAEALIEARRVTLDGQVATLGARVEPGSIVELDGRRVEPPATGTVLLLHKPAGVITSMGDPHGRPTVMQGLPDIAGLHPVGRLDLDSEGLLLLTDDGDLTLQLTHPRFNHEKRYRVWCDGGTPTETALRQLTLGVELDDGVGRADAAWPAPDGCILTLHEGRKRQVRRMLAAVGFPVTRLLRTHVAGVALGDLPVGAWREATPEERARLGYAPPKRGA